MILKALALENWMSFRGRHRLEGLAGRAYAVVARHVDDRERSNGFGKSAFVESILFALKGWTNPDRGLGVDGWITDGEKSGSVRAEFDDGYWIERSRSGRSWNLVTSTGARKDEAQQEIDRQIALTTEDLLATTFFRQRDMARFVLAKPEPRMEVVSEWLRLGPLERCTEAARKRMREIETEAGSVIHTVRTLEEEEQRALNGETYEALQERADQAQHALEALDGEVALARMRWRDALNRRADVEKVTEYDRLTEEGKALLKQIRSADAKQLRAEHDAIKAKTDEATDRVRDARREHEAKRRLALGQFDGHCPVAAIACPATSRINADRENNRRLFDAAAKRESELSTEFVRVSDELRSATAKLGELERLEMRFETMKERALKLKPIADAMRGDEAPGDPERLLGAERAAEAKRNVAYAECLRLKNLVNVVKDARERRARLADVARMHEGRLRTAREATLLFDRNGAQRRIAERSLQYIQQEANASLAGVLDLAVELRWSREGNGLARACDACGRPFPASQRAKHCETCGAERGPHLVHRLDLLLSAQGGAYEDLAGYAIQLAAGKWLRADRGSPLGVAVLDEPTGQFDATVRRAFVSKLPTMLASSGSRQAFVISHSADVLASLPGRIEIVSDGAFAKVSVVAA